MSIAPEHRRRRTLLVLGSKPDPVLPPADAFDDVACANASGYSARQAGLPDPVYTVMSAILTTGLGSGRQSLRALSGLRTGTLYHYPRPAASGASIKRLVRSIRSLRARPFWFRRVLRHAGYRWDHFVRHERSWWLALVRSLVGESPDVLQQVARKQPSTGLMAIALGVSQWDRVIVSGFSFELTHAYARNVEIDERGTTVSRHADTDVLVLGAISERCPGLFTTEPVVHERARLPLLPAPLSAAE